MGEKDIFPPEDGEDQEKPARKHEEHQNGQGDGEKEREEGVNILQPHHRDIPEQKNEKKKDQTGEN